MTPGVMRSWTRGETSLSWLPRDLATPTGVLVRLGIVVVSLLIAAPLVGGIARYLRGRRADYQGCEYLVGLAPVVGTRLGDHDGQGHRPRVGGYVDRAARFAAINRTRPRRLAPFSDGFLDPSRRI